MANPQKPKPEFLLNQSEHQPLQRLIELSAAQLRLSQVESQGPISEITNSFVQISADIAEIMENYPEAKTGEVKTRLSECILQFQFFDRMNQQIEHVVEQLQGISNTMLQNERSIADQLQQQMAEVQDFYSMDSQREIYRAVIEGEDINNLLSEKKSSHTNGDDSIDLF